MVAAAGADQLEHVGIAAFKAAGHDTDRLAANECCPAVARLTGKRQRHDGVGADNQPRITVIMLGPLRWGRQDSGDDVRIDGTAHQITRLSESGALLPLIVPPPGQRQLTLWRVTSAGEPAPR
jgi:hypothetical protein